jgi:hypothetical protein
MVFECPEQMVPRQNHQELFAQFGGWAEPTPALAGANAMHRFMGQNAAVVASFVRACELRALAQPPDDVMFGDPLSEEVSDDNFVDCFDDMTDVLYHALDSILEVPGIFPGPP